MNRIYAATAGVLIAAMLGVTVYFAFWARPDDPLRGCGGASVAGGLGSIGGSFTLVDEHGRTVTDKDVITGPTLVYFGYTFCPDVCPLDSARNAAVLELLEKRGIRASLVMITVDPERDTPEVMAEFTDLFHPRMIGLTGTPAQVKAAAQAYKAYYARQPGDDDYYLVDHSTFTYLVLPGRGVVDLFRRDETPEEMADRIACVLDALGGGV